jgi:hypothetical protein
MLYTDDLDDLYNDVADVGAHRLTRDEVSNVARA